MEHTKRLYRSIENRYIGGVCGGLARYFNMDVIIIRLIFFLALIFGGGGFLAYIILWIVVPEEPLAKAQRDMHTEETDHQEEGYINVDAGEINTDPAATNEKKSDGNIIAGLVLIVLGALFLADHLIPHLNFSDLWPVILIVAGIAVLLKNMHHHSKNKTS
ncbi:MAG: PspC domain-containing protein [Bacteroidales bacterium]